MQGPDQHMACAVWDQARGCSPEHPPAVLGWGESKDKPTFAQERACECECMQHADECQAAVINKHRRSWAMLPACITLSPSAAGSKHVRACTCAREPRVFACGERGIARSQRRAPGGYTLPHCSVYKMPLYGSLATNPFIKQSR